MTIIRIPYQLCMFDWNGETVLTKSEGVESGRNGYQAEI